MNIDDTQLKDSILTSYRLKITLDGKFCGVVQNCTIAASIEYPFIQFDGDRLETFVDDNGKTSVKIDENNEPISYKMSDMAAKNGGKLVVKNIEVDEAGSPTINVITLPKEGEIK